MLRWVTERQFPTFRKNILPLSLGSISPRRLRHYNAAERRELTTRHCVTFHKPNIFHIFILETEQILSYSHKNWVTATKHIYIDNYKPSCTTGRQCLMSAYLTRLWFKPNKMGRAVYLLKKYGASVIFIPPIKRTHI
jgi:hypothetical protein